MGEVRGLESRLKKLEQQAAGKGSHAGLLPELTGLLQWLDAAKVTPEDAVAQDLKPPPPVTRAMLVRLVQARADILRYRRERFPDGIVSPVVMRPDR